MIPAHHARKMVQLITKIDAKPSFNILKEHMYEMLQQEEDKNGVRLTQSPNYSIDKRRAANQAGTQPTQNKSTVDKDNNTNGQTSQLIREESQGNRLFQQVLKDRETVSNFSHDILRYGDIIYLKYNNHAFFNSLDSTDNKQIVINWPGYLFGDGLSNNKLYCIHKRKTSEVTITKCLFRIEPSKKYFQKKQFSQWEGTSAGQNISAREFNDKLRAAHEEKEDYNNLLAQSMGLPVTYGQGIIIRHIFSNTFLTLDVSQIARLIGNVQVNLVSEDNEYTNMKILPLSRLKEIGDYVYYSDEITLCNLREDHYYVHVSEFLNNRDEGLEVNGSELKTEWKPFLYLPFTAELKIYTNPNIIYPGEVVQIHNKAIGGGYLSISRLSLQKTAEFKKKLITTGGNASDLLNPIPMEFTYLMSMTSMESEVKIASESSFYTLWEIQKVRPFDADPPRYQQHVNYSESAVRLKNIATQYYLATDPHDSSRLILTYDGLNSENIFYFTSKTFVNAKGMVSKGDSVKIRNYKGKFIQPVKHTSKVAISPPGAIGRNSLDKNRKSFFPGELRSSLMSDEATVDLEFRFGCSNKSDPSMTMFEISETSKTVLYVANKLSSLFNQLMSFYTYFQDWAINMKSKKGQKVWYYNFELAQKYEKELESEVEQLTQNLKSIYEFLSTVENEEEGRDFEQYSVKSELARTNSLTYERKKHLMIEQNILEMLVLILQLVEFKTIGTLRAIKVDKDEEKDEQGAGKRQPVAYQVLKNYSWDKFALIPQLIAKNRLEKVVGLILKILILAAWESPECSYALSLHIEFFENLLDFYPNEIIDLGLEIAKNLSCEEETFHKFYLPWVKLLEEVNERSNNIKRQINIFRLLTSLSTSKGEKTAYPLMQAKLLETLHSDKLNTRRLKVMKFYLKEVQTSMMNDELIQVGFLVNNNRTQYFIENNPSISPAVIPKGQGQDQSVSVDLVKLCQPQSGYDASEHLLYIAAIIKLWASLCRERNKEAIKIATGSDVGLSQRFCTDVLKEKDISPIIKAAVLEFYTLVFLDSAPFEMVATRPFTCYGFERLELNVRIHAMLKKNVGAGNKNQDDNDGDKITDIVNGFHNNSIVCLNDVFSYLPRKVMEQRDENKDKDGEIEGRPDEARIINNLESSILEIPYILEFQAKALNLLKVQIDFGLANDTLIKRSIEVAGVVLKQPIDKNSHSARNMSALQFFTFCAKKKTLQQAYHQLVESALSLLESVSNVRKHYQACAFLKLWEIFSSQDFTMTTSQIIQAVKGILNIYSFSIEPGSLDKLTLSNLNQNINDIVNRVLNEYEGQQDDKLHMRSIDPHFKEDHDEPNNPAFSKSVEVLNSDVKTICYQRVPVDLILLEAMFATTKRVKQETSVLKKHQTYSIKQDIELLSINFFEERLQKALIEIPMNYFNQRLSLFKHLLQLEFYKGPEEKKIYKMLTIPITDLNHGYGGMSNSQIQPFVHDTSKGNLSSERENDPEGFPEKERDRFEKVGHKNVSHGPDISIVTFSKEVNEMLKLEEMGKCVNATQKARLEELVQSLASLLETAHNILCTNHQQKVYYRKMQNLMRNLGYHTLSLTLFQLKKDQGNASLSQACCKFLLCFINFNKQNQSLLVEKYDILFQAIPRGIDNSVLLSKLLHSMTVQSTINSSIEEIFRSLKRVLTSDSVSDFLNLQKTLATKSGFSVSKKVSRGLMMIVAYKDILQGLLVDEYGKHKRENQAYILASLINSPDIAKLYETNFLDLVRKVIQSRSSFNTGISEEDYNFFKFYAGMIAFVAELSKGCNECTEQARRISDSHTLLEYLLFKPSFYLLKREILRWYHFVYFEPQTQGTDGMKMSELRVLLKDLVFNDLKQFSVYAKYLSIGDNVEDRLKMDKQTKSLLVFKSPNEYWWYLGMAKGGEQKSYGMLHFAYFLIRYIKMKKAAKIRADEAKDKVEASNDESINFSELLIEIRSLLKYLLRELEDAPETSELRVLVCEILGLIPIDQTHPVSGPNHRRDEDQRLMTEESVIQQESSKGPVIIECKDLGLKGEYKVKKTLERLVAVIRHHLLTNRISWDDLVDTVVFKRTSNHFVYLKKLLGINESDYSLESVIFYLRYNNNDDKEALKEINTQPSVTTSEFVSDMATLHKEILTYKLKDHKVEIPIPYKNALADREKGFQTMAAENNSEVVKDSYESILKLYFEELLGKNKRPHELSLWVERIREKMYMCDDEDEAVMFIKGLQRIFVRSGKRAQIIRSLQFLLKRALSVNSDSSQEEPLNSDDAHIFRWLQDLLCEAEVPTLCISSMNHSMDYPLVNDCCEILYDLLKDGNHRVQKFIFTLLEENLFSKEFFHYIKDRFTNFVDLIKSESLSENVVEYTFAEMETSTLAIKLSGVSPNSMIVNIMQVLKLFCDNCYLDFQNFLRIQTTKKLKDNPFSIDMVTHVAEFLVLLVKEDPYLSQEYVCTLAKVALNTLTEFVIGPCSENQRVIIENKKLIETINTILSLSMTCQGLLTDKDVERADILYECAIFIESLVIGNQSTVLLRMLLDVLNGDALINRLIDVYYFRVRNHKKEVLLDIDCTRDQQCTDAECKEGHLSKLDRILIQAAFKIYLIMQLFIENLPENEKSKGFEHQQAILKAELSHFNKSDVLNHMYKSSEIKPLAQKAYIAEDEDSKDIERLHRERNRPLGFNDISFFSSKANLGIDQNVKRKRRPRSLSKLFRLKSGLTTMKSQDLFRSGTEEEQEILREYLEWLKRDQFNEARQFFGSYVASIEVLHSGQLVKVHFQIPYFCKYITENIKNSIIWKADRSSDHERLWQFFTRFHKYEYSMKRRQELSKKWLLYFFITNWQAIRILHLVLIALINIIMIAGMYYPYIVRAGVDAPDKIMIEGETGPGYINFVAMYYPIFIAAEIFQLVLSIANSVLTVYERLPICIFNWLEKGEPKQNKQSHGIKFLENTQRSSVWQSETTSAEFAIHKLPFMAKVRMSMVDIYNIYTFGMLIISILAIIKFKFLYAVLLFDLVRQSKKLQKLLYNSMRNLTIIVLTILMTVIVGYFFAILGFEKFPHIFNRGLIDDRFRSECRTMFQCFITIYDNGIRYRGGISDVIGPIEQQDFFFWIIIAFDISFYAIVELFLLSVLSGTFIDSVAEGRNRYEELYEDITNRCFICGLYRSELNRIAGGWYHHIYETHNVYNYLYFLIYIDKKDIGDCSSVEKYVKEMSRARDISFFPIGRTLALEKESMQDGLSENGERDGK